MRQLPQLVLHEHIHTQVTHGTILTSVEVRHDLSSGREGATANLRGHQGSQKQFYNQLKVESGSTAMK